MLFKGLLILYYFRVLKLQNKGPPLLSILLIPKKSILILRTVTHVFFWCWEVLVFLWVGGCRPGLAQSPAVAGSSSAPLCLCSAECPKSNSNNIINKKSLFLRITSSSLNKLVLHIDNFIIKKKEHAKS